VVFEGGLSAIASDYDSSATASAKADPDDPRRTKRSSRIANSNADSWYLLSTICYLLFAISAGRLFSGEPLQYEQDYDRSDDRQDQPGGMKR
jgi:hypothetical protein